VRTGASNTCREEMRVILTMAGIQAQRDNVSSNHPGKLITFDTTTMRTHTFFVEECQDITRINSIPTHACINVQGQPRLDI
jgi:hypothetical protein